ncbi:MAG: hypothetical protein A3G34_15665 [Candidatus Lindowbacteria bacterium RIFCSPLOWO2_12_FULL_62_27]|nr:MAG: hypothetical protein A3G34_15665 [Candidatus Lindowbacteria bacterium RIFCSPLOWO2_12_FULL_62_27]OGH63833.1 MAG: hypothetical protein A3I06_09945 [Candidatus Lindowbacteria bacterium RIFCSPLOWO2_02_FULL_62_12]
MTGRALRPEEILELEDKLCNVLAGLSATEGNLDVDSEFKEIMFNKSGPSEEAFTEIREMSRRFGPRLVHLLGFPPAPGTCKVRVLDQGMRAVVDIEPATGDGLPVTVEQVRKILQEQSVVFGLDDAAVEKAVESGRVTGVTGYQVAKGIPMQPGKDGRLAVVPQQPSAPPPVAVPASAVAIPFSELATVANGQKIARLLPPVPGTPGRDVHGRDIAAGAGKPIAPAVGKNVSLDAHEGCFYAKCPGRVVIDGNRIDVENLMVVPGDADISVGHILFPGELAIRGWVRSGLSIQADKDIVIEGGVEAATVRAVDGSIYISKGVQGSGRGMVQAAWDVTAKFVEQATVIAGGILKTQSAVNSELAGGDAVVVTEGRGVVIGGRIYAGARVEVRDLGAGSGESTVVQLGVTGQNLMALTKLKARRQAAQKALDDAEAALNRFGLSSEALQEQAMTDEGRQMLKLAKTVIVLCTRLKKIQQEEEGFIDSMKNRTDGELDVRGRVHRGVRILIGPATYYVSEALSWVRFKYDATRRGIKPIPLV